MKTMTHTPGPWAIQEDSRDGRFPLVIEGQPSPESPAGFQPAMIFGDGSTNRGVAMANARLVAAAPELLEALKEAERVVRWAAQESSGRVKSQVVGGWIHHADTIKKTIAKAEGRA